MKEQNRMKTNGEHQIGDVVYRGNNYEAILGLLSTFKVFLSFLCVLVRTVFGSGGLLNGPTGRHRKGAALSWMVSVPFRVCLILKKMNGGEQRRRGRRGSERSI